MATAAYTNGYRPFDFADFSGGLNLRDKADAVGDKQAVDLLNVTFTTHGAIRQRDGFTDLGSTDLANRVDSLSPFYTVAGARHLIAGCGTRLEAIDNNGAIVASMTGLVRGPYTFARFGDPTHEYLYAANGIDTLRRWNGGTWAAPTATVNGASGAMPRAGAVAVTAAVPGNTSGTNASNRLIATAYGTQTAAGPGGTESTPSRVHFSNPGQPEMWETDGVTVGGATPTVRGRNYIDLLPGDGEQIMAAVTWRELVFIFKETKFFVLWGEGTGADGTPTFQVREIVNSIGLASKQAVSVGRDGVYFFNRRGVYRTSGGDPTLLSDVIAPLWTGDPEIYYQGEAINISQLDLVRMVWQMEQLFVAVPTGSQLYNDRLLLYDTQHNWWTIYDIAASALAAFRRADRIELHHGYATGPQRIGHRNYGSTDDRGQRIVSRWRSGWSDYGSAQQMTLRETKVWGAGAIIVSFSTDYNRNQRANLDVPFTLSDVDWIYAQLTARGGTYADLASDFATYDDLAHNDPVDPVIDRALVRYAVRGTVFSTQFANSPDQPSWSVHRVSRHLREVREPSVR